MTVKSVDPACAAQLFKDFDGVTMASNQHPQILTLPLSHVDLSQTNICGQPTI
jgi:hypothetical protein